MISYKKWFAAPIHPFFTCGLVVLLVLIKPLLAQEWSLVGETVEPQWSSEGNQFWFQRIDEKKQREFLLVDALLARREPLFDHSAAVKAIQEKTTLDEQEIRRSWKLTDYASSSNSVTIIVGRNQLKIERATGAIE